MKRKLLAGLLLLPIAAVAILAVGVLAGSLPWQEDASPAGAQPPGRSSMQQRSDQVIGLLGTAGCETAQAAIDDGMEILYGGLRPLPSKDDPTTPGVDEAAQTMAADQAISDNELRFAAALGSYATGGPCVLQRGNALDIKLFIEEMNEVAAAVGEVTKKCGNGDSLTEPPCNELHTLLDENTGEEVPPRSHIPRIFPSFSLKLRSPLIPYWLRRPQEDVRVTEPTAPGECVVVFKETKGLMLRLHFEKIIIVTDPWVSTFGLPRGTAVPIWRLEWVPAEFVKEWNICNTVAGGGITKTVTMRVKQEIPLNFFWRYYPKDP